MELDRLQILEAARKHGEEDRDIVPAIRFPLRSIVGWPHEDAITLVGLTLDGLPIEVMIDVTREDRPVVFHAKRINERRQRELLGWPR